MAETEIATEAAEETVAQEEETPVETEAAEAETAAEETEPATEEADETVAETEAEESTEAGFTKGMITETGWESEWLGMRFVTADGMTMSTEEELNEMMGLGQEMLSEDFNDLQLEYAELNTVTEMQCVAADQVTNVALSVEKLPMELDIDTYQEIIVNQMSEVSVMTATFLDEGEDVVVAGKDFRKLKCAVDYEGLSIYQDYYFAIKDDRVASMVVTYVDEAEAEKLMAAFQEY